jgi:hypothetical protein
MKILIRKTFFVGLTSDFPAKESSPYQLYTDSTADGIFLKGGFVMEYDQDTEL